MFECCGVSSSDSGSKFCWFGLELFGFEHGLGDGHGPLGKKTLC
ncbi:hypothetical protein AGMMS49593_10700 [Endomicrobiia bacterium]|nr:hypothetical protein AGMMS49593_10700 [Endomicrobiia bacterium]